MTGRVLPQDGGLEALSGYGAYRVRSAGPDGFLRPAPALPARSSAAGRDRDTEGLGKAGELYGELRLRGQ